MDEKLLALSRFFLERPRCALAFSGGADSAFLLHAAARFSADFRAYYVKSAFQPAWELEDAKRFAASAGIKPVVLYVDILAHAEVAANDAQRCYHCKRAIMLRIWKQARADGYAPLIDGTNASDEAADRPGMRALSELSVLSPLRICGLDKADIRRLSREMGLESADKPAYACLATRVPAGTPIRAAELRRIEAAENALFKRGFADFRVRLMAGGALLQLRAEDQTRFLQQETELRALLQTWFLAVELDPMPRKGG